MTLLKRILDAATSVTAVVAGLCIVVMMLHVTADVVMRSFFGNPMTGTILIVANYYMVFLVCLPLAFVERFDSHISVEVLTERFPERVRHHLYGWTYPFTAVIFGIVAYATWDEAMSKFAIGSFIIEKDMAITTWFGYFALPFGYALLAAYVLLKFLAYLTGTPIPREKLPDSGDLAAPYD